MAVKGGYQDNLVEKKGIQYKGYLERPSQLEPVCFKVEQICICILLG